MRGQWSRSVPLLASAMVVFLGAPIWAADAPPPPHSGAFALTITLAFPTSYYFRGIAQSNAGFQFQPSVELKATLYDGGENHFLTGGFLKAAGFSHFQSAAAPINTNYYEQDVTLSGGLVLMKRAALEAGWSLYAYPGIGSSVQVQEVFGRASFDDSGLWPFTLAGGQDFALSPYMLIAGETSGGADGARPLGGSRGIYMELGIDPGYTFGLDKDWSVRLHLPFVLGLSLEKYYEVASRTGVRDKTFGYADLAVAADLPLKFMPPRFGRWTLYGGLHMLWLGDNNKSLAGPPSPLALNGLNVTSGSGFGVWGITGIKIEY